MPRQSSRSLGSAGDRPSAAPSVTAPSSLSLRSCRPQPQTLALRSFLPSLQGGLEREAAVGRRRRECGFAENKGAPSSPRSSSVRRVGSKAVPTSSVVATRQPTRDALGGGIGNVFRPCEVIGSPPENIGPAVVSYEPPPAPAPATAVLRGAAPSSRSTLITSASRASRPRKSAAP